MTRVFISIGTNLGDRKANLARALALLPPAFFPERVSALYDTEPQLVADQPRFYNIAVAATTALPPEEALRKLKSIEREMGRTDGPRYGPRLIDLDLLYYDGVVLDSPELTLPHPRIAERAFVLAPLSDIAPDFADPVSGRTVAQMLAAIPDADKIVQRL